MTLRSLMAAVAVTALILGGGVSLQLIEFVPTALLATLAVRVIAGRGGRWSPRAALGLVSLVVLVSFALSVTLSKMYWGYYFNPPPLDRRIKNAQWVRTLSYIQTRSDNFGGLFFAFSSRLPVPGTNAAVRRDPRISACRRTFDALNERNILSAGPGSELPHGSLVGLYEFLEKTGCLVDGGPSFPKARDLKGFVLETVGDEGKPVALVSVFGGEVSDGHYPYYEFLLKGRIDGGRYELDSSQRYFVDIGRFEGIGWRELFAASSALGMLILILVGLFRNLRRGKLQVSNA
jgi:hypothetical protein